MFRRIRFGPFVRNLGGGRRRPPSVISPSSTVLSPSSTAEKVTIMVLKADLECTKCNQKIKRILCQFPQVRDQVYNEKANTVTITVICCSPEKIRDRLCYKGRGIIKSIDIKEPEKPKTVDKPPAAAADKPKDTPKPVVVVAPPQPAASEKPPPKPTESAPKTAEPVAAAGYLAPYPSYGVRYVPYYEGPSAGPYYTGHGMPAPPCNCGRSVWYDGYTYGRGYTEGRCDCFSEENPSACTVM